MRKLAPVEMFMFDPVIELDDITKSAPVEMLRLLDPVIELDDDMRKSAPVEISKFVFDPVIELDDDMTKSAPVEIAKFVFDTVIELDDHVIELDVDRMKSAPVEMLMRIGGSALDIKIWALHVLTAYVAPDVDKPKVVYKEPAL
jgi:hypothetical protein